MDGGPRSRKAHNWLALLAVLALATTACGTAGDSQAVPDNLVPPAETIDRIVDPGVVETDVEESTPEALDLDTAGDRVPTDVSDLDRENPVDPENESPGEDTQKDLSVGDELVDSEPVENPEEQQTQVLAFALNAIEDSDSYSFTQGMRMDMSMLGIDITFGGDAPLMYGTAEGSRSYALIDMGTFMTSIFEGMDVGDANGMDQLVALFSGTEIETWVDIDAGVMIYDMSELASVLGAMDPSATDEMSLFEGGPVLINMNEFEGEFADFVTEYGSGAQVIDPTQIAEVLRGLDEISETGTDEVSGREVTAFSGSISMSDYTAALGQDLDEAIDSLDSLGTGGIGADMFEDMLASMASAPVDVVVMVDNEGLLRRMELAIDMGPMFEALVDSDDPELSLLGHVNMTLETWQEFDEYGGSFAWTPPVGAVDLTAEFNELMAGAVG